MQRQATSHRLFHLRDDVVKVKAALTECENKKAEEVHLKDKVGTA